MTNVFTSRNRCPFCRSDNVVPLNPETFVCTGAGGIVGGVIAALAGKGKGMSAGKIIAGAITGITAGLSLGKAIRKNVSGSTCTSLCLDCFRTFDGSVEQSI